MERFDLETCLTIAARDASDALARQLRWVAGELRLGHAGGQLPPPRDMLTDAAAADTYLRAARAGLLRSRASARPTSSDASIRVRINCLRALAHAAGLGSPALEVPPAPEPEPPPPGFQLSSLRGFLEERASSGWPPRRVRDAAVLAVALDVSARTGALAVTAVDDLDLDAGTIVMEEAPPGSRKPPHRVRHQLDPQTLTAVRRWLTVRASIVRPRVDALWVSVAGNHRGDGTRTPPGLPLRARGLTRSIARTIAEANVALLSDPGWRPLPERLGALRSRLQGERG